MTTDPQLPLAPAKRRLGACARTHTLAAGLPKRTESEEVPDSKKEDEMQPTYDPALHHAEFVRMMREQEEERVLREERAMPQANWSQTHIQTESARRTA